MFVNRMRHGHGNSQASGAAGVAVVPGRVGGSAGASVLPQDGRGLTSSRIRWILRGTVPVVLCRQSGPAIFGAWRLLPADANRVLRGFGQRAGNRVAYGGFAQLAAV